MVKLAELLSDVPYLAERLMSNQEILGQAAPVERTKNPTENSGNYYSGTEPFIGQFMQAQVALSGMRLVHDGKITQNVSDLAAQIETIRRNFVHNGDADFALQEVNRVTVSFGQRVQRWESEAAQRKKLKRGMNANALAKMRTELGNVRAKIKLGQRTLTKLGIELHQIIGEENAGNGIPRPHFSTAGGSVGPTGVEVEERAEPKAPVETVSAQFVKLCVEGVYDSLKKLLDTNEQDQPILSVDQANANLIPLDIERRVEQVFSREYTSTFPVFLVAGWGERNPEFIGRQKRRRYRDLFFWLVPKSDNASRALSLASGQIQMKLEGVDEDPVEIKFTAAEESDELPGCQLFTGFANRFEEGYKIKPVVLMSSARSLDWSQTSATGSLIADTDVGDREIVVPVLEAQASAEAETNSHKTSDTRTGVQRDDQVHPGVIKRCAKGIEKALKQLFDIDPIATTKTEFSFAIENGNPVNCSNASEVEQILDKEVFTTFPVSIVVGSKSNERSGSNTPPADDGKSSVDINVWVIPKSENASLGLNCAHQKFVAYLGSFGFNLAKSRFELAKNEYLPKSPQWLTFARRFEATYQQPPTVLVARFESVTRGPESTFEVEVQRIRTRKKGPNGH